MHCMIISAFENKAFLRVVQNKITFHFSVIVRNNTTAMNTNRRLHCCFMSVSSAHRIIYAVNIKYTLYIKRYFFFNDSEITTRVGKCFQIYNMCHLYFHKRIFVVNMIYTSHLAVKKYQGSFPRLYRRSCTMRIKAGFNCIYQ